MPKRFPRGFTLIELMVTLVIVAIAVSLAVPTFRFVIEKRRITSAAEDIVSFIATGQSLAVKTNDFVTVKWSALNANGSQSGDSSHPPGWCLGMFDSEGYPAAAATDVDDGCDCRVRDPGATGACTVDGTLYRMSQDDFVNINSEFMDFDSDMPRGHFTFDPVRGTVGGFSHADVFSSRIFDIHTSNETRIDGRRLYELRVRMRATGEASICTDASSQRVSIVGGYKSC